MASGLHASLESWPLTWVGREGPSVSFLAHPAPPAPPGQATSPLSVEAAVRPTSAYMAALWALESGLI